MPDPVQSLALTIAEVTPRTRWIFLEVASAAGLRGTGEASLAGAAADVLAATQRLAPLSLDLPDAAPDQLPDLALADLPAAAAYSALDQALWDIAAQRAGLPLAAALGPAQRRRIPLYANINRRTVDRSPEGFAASAGAALAAGHRRLKIAPFDEATPAARQEGRLAEAIRPGLARAAAVREAAPPGIEVMIDCHWRLDVAAAETVIDAAAERGIGWIECPLPEHRETLDALRRLRGRANAAGARLAGCEQQIRLDGFLPFLEAGAYDVMMPDVKYAGGLREMLRIAATMQRFGVAFSPHNPTGPICHAASLHVGAAVPALDGLEMQFDETDAFAALQAPALPPDAQGCADLPAGIGLGLALDPVVLETVCIQRWQAP